MNLFNTLRRQQWGHVLHALFAACLFFFSSGLSLTSLHFHKQEQFSQVLDAMFELKVQPQEHVIDQGHDGDNFYVIER